MDTERPVVRYAPWNSNDCAEQRFRQASPGEYGDGWNSAAALLAPEKNKCNQYHKRQREPGYGVLHVIVLVSHRFPTVIQIHALRCNSFQIDIERRDGLA